ncbi:hypothetical protein QP866_03070 [Corynebacterium imitans]|uniref:hypothetical protein n=1 Tax=Corynebacterium imitans TaxID=156978 RepID=UPI00254DEA27|nr:hypothetical protein [Corynebacterium imitans]MDK8305725.1 hypothetical protein [Corynebacterium imitans]MDK8636809.1 hypothetical protein [Corynebacterium imitans]MDK8772424.1 hypothetical protein [Corynebacterium imitans]
MKRISTAVVAAATALAMTATPAFAAEENQNDQNVTGEQGTENPEQPKNPGEGSEDGEGTEDPEKSENPGQGDNGNQGGNTNKTQGSAGSSNGHVVGITSGLAGATVTLALIIGSNPTGLNKIIDYLNANFQLGLPHLHVPKVQLPNIPNFF